MSAFTLYKTEEEIAKSLTKVSFTTFCTDLLGEPCNIIVNEDYMNIEDDEYPAIIINADRQSGGGEPIARHIEFTILLKISNERQMISGYSVFLEKKQAEQVAVKIYENICENFCQDTPNYFFENDTTLISQKAIKGKLEIVTQKETTLGGKQW